MLLFTVHRDYNDQWRCSSFGGTSEAEERKFAMSASAEVSLITHDFDKAQFRLRRLRAEQTDQPAKAS